MDWLQSRWHINYCWHCSPLVLTSILLRFHGRGFPDISRKNPVYLESNCCSRLPFWLGTSFCSLPPRSLSLRCCAVDVLIQVAYPSQLWPVEAFCNDLLRRGFFDTGESHTWLTLQLGTTRAQEVRVLSVTPGAAGGGLGSQDQACLPPPEEVLSPMRQLLAWLLPRRKCHSRTWGGTCHFHIWSSYP